MNKENDGQMGLTTGSVADSKVVAPRLPEVPTQSALQPIKY